MRQEYIILRGARSNTRDIFLGPSLGPSAGVSSLESAASVELSVEVGEMERKEIRALTRSPDVVAMAPVIPMKLIAPIEARDTPGPGGDGTAWGISAVGADTSPFTGDGIVVAVLDTGIDASHPAFKGGELVQRDFTGTGNGDTHGHGTHCAGTIFGRDVGGTRIGVAPGVKRALIGKVLGGKKSGGSDQVLQAIQWATDNGANVISMSLGIDFPGFVKQLVKAGLPTDLATSRALEGYRANLRLFDAVASLLRERRFIGSATVLVAAAGNASRRDEDPDFEIGVEPPAISEGIVAVAAVGKDPDGMVCAPFSNTGAQVAGPGVDILSARTGGGLATMSGTSMATPHVAGVAALWAEKIRESTGSLDPVRITNRLIGSATTDGFRGDFDATDIGEGIVQAPQS